MLIHKTMSFKESNINTEQMVVEGYAATWDKDQVDDIIHPGAFKKSIDEAFPKKRIKTLWQHNQPFGMPIEMVEDSKGLYTKTKVTNTAENRDRLEYMKDGVVDKMSIGFSIPLGKSEWDENEIRHIYEVKLFEYSMVTFPANENADVTSVKDLKKALMNRFHVDHIDDETMEEIKALLKKRQPRKSGTVPSNEQPQNADEQAALKHLFESLQQATTFAQNRLY